MALPCPTPPPIARLGPNTSLQWPLVFLFIWRQKGFFLFLCFLGAFSTGYFKHFAQKRQILISLFHFLRNFILFFCPLRAGDLDLKSCLLSVLPSDKGPFINLPFLVYISICFLPSPPLPYSFKFLIRHFLSLAGYLPAELTWAACWFTTAKTMALLLSSYGSCSRATIWALAWLLLNYTCRRGELNPVFFLSDRGSQLRW